MSEDSAIKPYKGHGGWRPGAGRKRKIHHYQSPPSMPREQRIFLLQEVKRLADEKNSVAAISHILHIEKTYVRTLLAIKHPSRDTAAIVTIKPLLPKSCELCNYTRVIEVAHIIPHKSGGTEVLSNLLSLCRNCHWLFDHDLTTKGEKVKLNILIAHRKATPIPPQTSLNL